MDHIPPTGLPINFLKKLQENLQEPVSRELHAFCHLCPADSPAALELVTLNKHALLQLGQTCKEPLTSRVAAPVITRHNLMLQALQLKVQLSLQTYLLSLLILCLLQC